LKIAKIVKEDLMRRVVLLLVALALAAPAVARAQGKPDFSGTWKYDKSDPPGYRGTGGGWAVPAPTFVMTQTATQITVESETYGKPMKMVYKLDGSDTITEATGESQSGIAAVVRWRTKAAWDGTKLKLYTWNTALNQMRDTMTLTGTTLSIARVTENPGGSTTTKLNYTK
jgi:hypothetical protein